MQRSLSQSGCADGNAAVLSDADSAGRAAAAVFICQQDGEAAIDDADEGVRGAEVDAKDGRV